MRWKVLRTRTERVSWVAAFIPTPTPTISCCSFCCSHEKKVKNQTRIPYTNPRSHHTDRWPWMKGFSSILSFLTCKMGISMKPKKMSWGLSSTSVFRQLGTVSLVLHYSTPTPTWMSLESKQYTTHGGNYQLQNRTEPQEGITQLKVLK